MSLAMVSALFFSCPFFMSMFAKFFLKEQIGIRRWSAIVVGFIGVLIVLNPTLEEFNFFKLAPVGCALCYACSMTITKYTCLLYTSPSPRDATLSRMPSSA